MTAQAEYTIDGLARAAETTVRSVRVYHERGVLPPPQVRGRIGYYGPEHLNRLRTISRLLSRGVKLNGIKELLEAWDRGEGLADILGVEDIGGEPAELTLSEPGAAHDRDGYGSVDDSLSAELSTRLLARGLSNSEAGAALWALAADCHQLVDVHGPLLERLGADDDELRGLVARTLAEMIMRSVESRKASRTAR